MMALLSPSPGIALIWYQARLTWRLQIWIAPLVALLLPVFLFLPSGALREFAILQTAERFAPLLGLLVFANLLAQEWEDVGADLWLAKPVSRVGLLLARVLVGVVWMLLALLPLYTVLYFWYGSFNWSEMLLASLPPTLFLGMFGMTVGLLARSSAVAFLVSIAYWVFEETTDGVYTGPLYLFARTGSPCQESIEVCMRASAEGPWLFTKLLLLGATAALVGVSAWLLGRMGRPWR
jgi:hypothetical protein